jgi:hypothetical protein
MAKNPRMLVAIGCATVGMLLQAPAAVSFDRPPLIEQVASTFALRPVDVRCPTMQEWVGDSIWGNGPNPQRAWGYTDMINDFSVIQPLLCAGAAAVTDPAVPAWQRATGVLVLVHESYHLRRWKWRRSEPRVECQAIRHFVAGAELLGAPPELADDLLPYALAAHASMTRLFPNYDDRRCKLPLWTPPFSP